MKRFIGIVFLGTIFLTISSCTAHSRQMGETVSENGLAFRLLELSGQLYLEVEFDSTDYEQVAFPNAGNITIEKDGETLNRFGESAAVSESAQNEKLIGAADVAVIRKGTSLLFEIADDVNGDVVIQVDDSYSGELEKAIRGTLTLLWTGTVRIDATD